jgi:hypothetical protein
MSESAQGLLLRVVGAGEQRAQQQRLLDAVPCRFQRDHAQSAFGVLRDGIDLPRRFLGDVEELAGGDIATHPCVLPAHLGCLGEP